MADAAWEVIEDVEEDDSEEEEEILVVQKEDGLSETNKDTGVTKTTTGTNKNIGALVEAIASDVALLQRDFAEVISPCPASKQMQSIEASIRRMERRLDEIERVVANVQYHQLVSQNHRGGAGTPQHSLFQSLSESVSDAMSFK